MYLVLFAVGLLVIAAGFLTIGFGIPINAFSLGNTLIVAGTVAVVGGFVVIGLAAALRQLNRIGEALNSRPVARLAPSPVHATEAADSLVPPTARIAPPARTPPQPPEAVMPRPSEPRPAAEPRFPAAASERPGPLDWLRAKPKTMDAPPLAAEAPAGVPDEAPPSPREPQRPMFSPPPYAASPVSAPPAEPKPWLPTRASAPEPMPKQETPPSRSETVARATPPVDPDAGRPAAKDAGLFDVVWPDARSRPMSAEPAKREPTPRPREESRIEPRAEPAPERVAILKSGVIDGMAYTLYADGSIEAELPQGTVKFASVDALRAHLEKSA